MTDVPHERFQQFHLERFSNSSIFPNYIQFHGSFLGPSYSCFDVLWAATRACLDDSNILEEVYLGYRFSINVTSHAFSSSTTISLVFRHSVLVVLCSQHHLPCVLCCLFPVEIYRTLPWRLILLSRPLSLGLLAPCKHRRAVEIDCIPAVCHSLWRKAWCVIRPNVRFPIVSHRAPVPVRASSSTIMSGKPLWRCPKPYYSQWKL